MKNLERLAREYERRHLEDLRRLLASAPSPPRRNINANALRTARALRNAPRAPTHRVNRVNRRNVRRANARANARPMNLNAKLRALHAAMAAQKRRRALENEERRMRLLALQFPAAPRTRVSRR